MNKGGIGSGSASIVLIFAVLCLTVFTLITLTGAEHDAALANAEAALVTAYYEADTLAEQVLADILNSDAIPATTREVEVFAGFDTELGTDIAEFSCPMSDKKELYVKIALYTDHYDIISWKMRDIGQWESDDGVPVWQGVDIGEDLPPVWMGR